MVLKFTRKANVRSVGLSERSGDSFCMFLWHMQGKRAETGGAGAGGKLWSNWSLKKHASLVESRALEV